MRLKQGCRLYTGFDTNRMHAGPYRLQFYASFAKSLSDLKAFLGPGTLNCMRSRSIDSNRKRAKTFTLHKSANTDMLSTIQERFEQSQIDLTSLRKTLDPLSQESARMGISHLEQSIHSLECVAVIFAEKTTTYIDESLSASDILYIKNICKDMSSIRAKFIRAITSLRIALEIRTAIETMENEGKYADLRYRWDYYKCLEECFNNISGIIVNCSQQSV